MTLADVKLTLDLRAFDEAPFVPILQACTEAGIGFETLHSLGDTPAHRRRLYAINKLCAGDIPERGTFFTYEAYCAARFERVGYDPRGVVLALDRESWVGLAVTSSWRPRGFCFNEMTGVIRAYRRRGIATAMKLLGIRFARSCGVARIYTVHHPLNVQAIRMNRRLGFTDSEWDPRI